MNYEAAAVGRLVKQTGASLVEGGWRVSSDMLEPPRGGGAGERCVMSCRPQDGMLRSSRTPHLFCHSHGDLS